jgi:DNA polymerase III sliding clamp (beta) subunit (PCNA family)
MGMGDTACFVASGVATTTRSTNFADARPGAAAEDVARGLLSAGKGRNGEMLNRHNLDIAKLAATEEGRYTITGIFVTPKETVVTDGTLLVKVTTPKTTAESFPEMAHVEPATDEFEPFVLSKRAALEVAKAIPKSKHLPALEQAAVSAETDKNGESVLYTHDLEFPRVFRERKLAGNFPDFERVIPAPERATFTIGLNADLLVKMLQTALRFKADKRAPCVKFSFSDEKSAVRIDATNDQEQEFIGVLMPMRT